MKITQIAALMFLMLGPSSTNAAEPNFVGTYAGTAGREEYSPGAFGESLVARLEITAEGGHYKLTALMNATNREEGMDHTSNSYWRWTGNGDVRHDTLIFTASEVNDKTAMQGSLRKAGREFTMILDKVKYRLHTIANDPDS